MAARTMKVRVPVATLVELAEKQRAKIVSEHAKALEKVGEDTRRWQEKALSALAHAAEQIEAGKLPEIHHSYSARGQSYFNVKVRVPAPSEPDAQPNTRKVDRDLALLRACSDETLLIGADDNFAQYL